MVFPTIFGSENRGIPAQHGQLSGENHDLPVEDVSPNSSSSKPFISSEKKMAEPAEPEDLSVKYTSILPMTTSNLCASFSHGDERRGIHRVKRLDCESRHISTMGFQHISAFLLRKR